jgi:hypothetical protein
MVALTSQIGAITNPVLSVVLGVSAVAQVGHAVVMAASFSMKHNEPLRPGAKESPRN